MGNTVVGIFVWATEIASQALILLGDLYLIFVKSDNTAWHTVQEVPADQ